MIDEYPENLLQLPKIEFDCGSGWAVWDHQGGFALRDQDGSPTPILEGLFAHRRGKK